MSDTVKSAIIWSNVNCTFCEQAKSLLKANGIDYEERNLASGVWSREQLLEVVPTARTVPQIFINDNYIGGFTELRNYLQEAV
jgi:glutaredoxin 3